jgi:hypothetical protein
MPIVADFYTRLYPAERVSVHDQPLFAALNHLADTMRLRWHQEAEWLQFRSASFYDDRLKEVPYRLLSRWSEARRRRGFLTLDDLCEIVQLSDAQLDAEAMAEGAKEIWGLAEWDLVRAPFRRPHLRYLAGFSPEQRQEVQSDPGLPFDRMSLAQQQGFITLGLGGPNQPLQSMEELAGAALRVEYTQPDQFEWPVPGAGYLQWVVPVEPGPQGRRVLMPLIRARSREETAAAITRMSASLREALLREERRLDPQFDEARLTPQQAQIRRADLELRLLYFPGVLNRRHIHVIASEGDFYQSTW